MAQTRELVLPAATLARKEAEVGQPRLVSRDVLRRRKAEMFRAQREAPGTEVIGEYDELVRSGARRTPLPRSKAGRKDVTLRPSEVDFQPYRPEKDLTWEEKKSLAQLESDPAEFTAEILEQMKALMRKSEMLQSARKPPVDPIALKFVRTFNERSHELGNILKDILNDKVRPMALGSLLGYTRLDQPYAVQESFEKVAYSKLAARLSYLGYDKVAEAINTRVKDDVGPLITMSTYVESLAKTVMDVNHQNFHKPAAFLRAKAPLLTPTLIVAARRCYIPGVRKMVPSEAIAIVSDLAVIDLPDKADEDVLRTLAVEAASSALIDGQFQLDPLMTPEYPNYRISMTQNNMRGPDGTIVRYLNLMKPEQQQLSLDLSLTRLINDSNQICLSLYYGRGSFAGQVIRLNTVQAQVEFRKANRKDEFIKFHVETLHDYLDLQTSAEAAAKRNLIRKLGRPKTFSEILKTLADAGVVAPPNLESEAGPPFNKAKKSECLLAIYQWTDKLYDMVSSGTSCTHLLEQFPWLRLCNLKQKREIQELAVPATLTPDHRVAETLTNFVQNNATLKKVRTIGVICPIICTPFGQLESYLGEKVSKTRRAVLEDLRLLDSEVLSLKGLSPSDGEFDLLIASISRESPFTMSDATRLWHYSDNVYMVGKVSGTVDASVIHYSPTYDGERFYGEGPVRLRDEYVLLSLDGSKMESATDLVMARAYMETEAKYYSFPRALSEMWTKILSAQTSAGIGILENFQYALDYMSSGAPHTFTLNDALMHSICHYYLKRRGSREHNVQLLIDCAADAGVEIKVQSCLLLTPGRPIAVDTKPVVLDLLGLDVVAAPTAVVPAELSGRSLYLPALSRDRIIRSLIYSKKSGPKSNAAIVNASKALSLYLYGGWSDPAISELCKMMGRGVLVDTSKEGLLAAMEASNSLDVVSFAMRCPDLVGELTFEDYMNTDFVGRVFNYTNVPRKGFDLSVDDLYSNVTQVAINWADDMDEAEPRHEADLSKVREKFNRPEESQQQSSVAELTEVLNILMPTMSTTVFIGETVMRLFPDAITDDDLLTAQKKILGKPNEKLDNMFKCALSGLLRQHPEKAPNYAEMLKELTRRRELAPIQLATERAERRKAKKEAKEAQRRALEAKEVARETRYSQLQQAIKSAKKAEKFCVTLNNGKTVKFAEVAYVPKYLSTRVAWNYYLEALTIVANVKGFDFDLAMNDVTLRNWDVPDDIKTIIATSTPQLRFLYALDEKYDKVVAKDYIGGLPSNTSIASGNTNALVPVFLSLSYDNLMHTNNFANALEIGLATVLSRERIGVAIPSGPGTRFQTNPNNICIKDLIIGLSHGIIDVVPYYSSVAYQERKILAEKRLTKDYQTREQAGVVIVKTHRAVENEEREAKKAEARRQRAERVAAMLAAQGARPSEPGDEYREEDEEVKSTGSDHDDLTDLIHDPELMHPEF